MKGEREFNFADTATEAAGDLIARAALACEPNNLGIKIGRGRVFGVAAGRRVRGLNAVGGRLFELCDAGICLFDQELKPRGFGIERLGQAQAEFACFGHDVEQGLAGGVGFGPNAIDAFTRGFERLLTMATRGSTQQAGDGDDEHQRSERKQKGRDERARGFRRGRGRSCDRYQFGCRLLQRYHDSMCSPQTLKAPPASHPLVRRVRKSWRALTGGSAVRDAERATLVACSGGADSAALVLALATRRIVVAHVVHDLRPRAEALADRDATAGLARDLGLPFVESDVAVGPRGNAEAEARRKRYRALAALAEQARCPFIATGHQADDQIETLLMRLTRGAGVGGMRGILATRACHGRTLIRPMLGLNRQDAEALCSLVGYAWRVDETNADVSRTRAALRQLVVPALAQIDSRAHRAAASTALHMHHAFEALEACATQVYERAERAGDAEIAFDRVLLRETSRWLVGRAIRRSMEEMAGRSGLDKASSDVMDSIVQAVMDRQGGERRWSLRTVDVVLTRDRLIVARRVR